MNSGCGLTNYDSRLDSKVHIYSVSSIFKMSHLLWDGENRSFIKDSTQTGRKIHLDVAVDNHIA